MRLRRLRPRAIVAAMDKAAKKALRQQVRAQERAAARDAFPFTHEALLELFESVDEAMAASPCDHTLRHTRAWLADRSQDPAIVVAWLQANGGYCDCEVLYNVAPHVEDAMHDA